MAKSKRQKRIARNNAKANNTAYQASQKSYVGGSFGYYGTSAYGGRVYRPDEFSAALADTFNVAVARSVKFWEQWLNGLKWEIRSGADDSVLISSDNRRIPLGMGAKFAHAIKAHRKHFKHGYFTSLAFSDSLYSESYTHFICNDYGTPTAIEWVNPLAIEPMIMRGCIEWYQYNNAEGYETLRPHQVAMRITNRDPQNDLRGLSPVMSVIDSLNIEAAEKESLKAWFKNNMQLGGLISPSNPDINMSIGQTQKLEDDFRRDNKGVVNAGRWAIAPANMTVTPFPAPDIEKNFQLLKPLRDEIQMAMGTYPQLVGDPSAANYDSAYDIKRQWWELLGIPYAHDIEDYINEQILPILEPQGDCYFAFVLTPYEVEQPDVITQDFNAGYIDISTAQKQRGYDVNKKLEGIYLINGIPMHEDIIQALSRKIPSQYALDYANAEEANSNADAAAGIAKPINPVLPSGNEAPESPASEIISPYLTSINGEKKSLEGLPSLDDGTPIVEAPLPATLHSAHDGIPDDIHHSHGLGQDVVSMIDDSKKAYSVGIDVGHGDSFTVIHSHDLPEILDTPDTSALDELAAWKKFVTNGKSQKRAFEAVVLRGDMADALQLAIDSHDKQSILDTFKAVFDKLSVKAIQATRLDFENDFTELLSRARSEKMNRQGWASAMRVIGRRYGTKAYIDGMSDGGLEDEPSEDDRVTINELVAAQSPYITELGNVLYKEDGISDAQADGKAAIWFNKSIAPLYYAGLESAAKDALFEWSYNPSIENHCQDCERLNGQRHRLKGWKANYMPQSDNLDCNGFNCECRLVPVKGRARGNY